MNNVKIYDNGSAFMITVNGLIVCGFNSLGGAWNHIAWMYRVASQQFTVGDKKTPVKEWLDKMIKAGYLESNCGFHE